MCRSLLGDCLKAETCLWAVWKVSLDMVMGKIVKITEKISRSLV